MTLCRINRILCC